MKKSIFKKDVNLIKISCLFVFSVILILIDQLIKFFVVNNVTQFEIISLIPEIVNLTNVRNYGVAFSFFSNHVAIVSFATVLIIAFTIYLLYHNKIYDLGCLIAATMLISGGIGNLIDRIFRGFVVDYLDLFLGEHFHFAVINLADCLITIGCFVLIVKIIYSKNFSKKFLKFN